uniref:Uncharacterized protein n=1 Tax=viral metagenome TaxID=1070528 RepID=A0A6C0K177_9ZZZZ
MEIAKEIIQICEAEQENVFVIFFFIVNKKKGMKQQQLKEKLSNLVSNEEKIHVVNELLSSFIGPKDCIRQILENQSEDVLKGLLTCLINIITNHLRYFINHVPDFKYKLERLIEKGLKIHFLKERHTANRKARDLPIIHQIFLREDEIKKLRKRCHRAIMYLFETILNIEMPSKGTPIPIPSSVRLSDEQNIGRELIIALSEAKNTLEREEYFLHKEVWLENLLKKGVYLHDDMTNITGFLMNLNNLLFAIEKLYDKDKQDVKKIFSRITFGCLDFKIESINRYLLSSIDTSQPLLRICGNIYLDAKKEIFREDPDIKIITKLDLARKMLKMEESSDLFGVLNYDFNYRRKCIKELQEILKLTIAYLILTSDEGKIGFFMLIIDALIAISSIEVDENGNIILSDD